jgi:hypothetical protein
MKKYLLLVFCMLSCHQIIFAQQKISGIVKNTEGKGIPGVSVSLEQTLDGTTTDEQGAFQFETTETGTQTLNITATGYEEVQRSIVVEESAASFSIVLQSTIGTTLNQVTITAGTFGSAEGTNKTVLEPLDIVTTAGSGADPVGSVQMLPGVQKNGNNTGLIVRGGDASEAAVVVDGLVLQNPFFSDAPGVQQRSRFNAFQFKGIAFSSGGYSARYGQAMSSVLEMNTLDFPDNSTVNLGIHMAGLYASATKIFNDNHAVTIGANYTNLTPFYKIAKTNFDFYEPPTGGGGSLNYIWKPSRKSLVKLLANFSRTKSGIMLPNPFVAGSNMKFGITNTNGYSQLTYKQELSSKLRWFTAASYSYNDDNTTWDTMPLHTKEQRAQLRTELNWYIKAPLTVVTGVEAQVINVQRTMDTLGQGFEEKQIAAYAETDWSPKHWLAVRPGLRLEHSGLLQTTTLAPRLSTSFKLSKSSIASIAGGLFYQSPDRSYLLQGLKAQQQLAVHYIANYMWNKEDRILRLEGYYKSYAQLVKENIQAYDPNMYRYIWSSIDNRGHGYATGVELFWRDKKTIKNFEYWLTYSYINTKRLYRNFPTEATPSFIADHNLNIVTKYWVHKLDMMVSATASLASGRPYYNPANPLFLQDRTPSYQNLALQVSHLRSFGKWFAVFYLSVDNVLNRNNIFGYRYNVNSSDRYPIHAAMNRAVFIGCNFSLSKFDKDEL